MFNIFENPWGLVTIAGVTVFILLILRSAAAQKCRWWLWLVPVVLVLGAFGLDSLVETDREKIIAVIDASVSAVENEDADSMEQIIAEDYSDSYHSTKNVLMTRFSTTLSVPLIEKNIKRIVSIDIQPPNAAAVFTVRILFDKQSYVYQSFRQQMLVKVQMYLQKQSDNSWLISQVELLEIDFRPAGWQFIEQASQ